jgi:hypothetical protein
LLITFGYQLPNFPSVLTLLSTGIFFNKYSIAGEAASALQPKLYNEVYFAFHRNRSRIFTRVGDKIKQQPCKVIMGIVGLAIPPLIIRTAVTHQRLFQTTGSTELFFMPFQKIPRYYSPFDVLVLRPN